ncbi:uncharacterized protein NECHADRAFT_78163 [Fusarium vanettenii 77-13-4]|uniref:non-specific serine/threonine protein kinase n=1 Tax=Fusarium vanettenii (strain ATCC MYA-4622 / CBS 123669 / FGSC 9596 / NRRL 45880 / 77-13-4) TaxID=660122 RepID=C7YNA7_FUSV7|nr:uncharacterized protein NECHADRAFT_78163 [Fusarium vanettenii 77-13-4]EEU47588.1 predicted protein [Fusarium vanettenii 77-13-4]
MNDSDIIACVYPHSTYSNIASQAIAASWLCPNPPQDLDEIPYNRSERERTGSPDDTIESLPCAEIRFSNIPRTGRGIIIGSHPDCDIVVLKRGISSRHISITFDEQKRLIVKDWGSLIGTQVTYDGQGAGKRSKFQWIIGGPEIPRNTDDLILEIRNDISFRIVISQHEIYCPEYIEKVDRFCHGTASPEELLDDLNLISRPMTMAPTGANTPGRDDIYLGNKLGEGSFGVVTHLWNPHIVELIVESFVPKPRLFLEYMPGGSLDDHTDFTINETLTILRQCLSALKYLHDQEPPIAHRDIKPANILVKFRTENFIFVKLGDFGVSGDSSELMTVCGTQKYMAPEIYQEWQQRAGGKRKRGYNETVDIWSLGVVAYELLDGLPRYASDHRRYGMKWCEAIVKKLQEDVPIYKDNLRRFLLGSILVISPTSRLSARDAYREAINLSSEGDETPSSGGSSPGSLFDAEEEDEGTIVQRAPEDDTTSLLNPLTMVPASTITTISPQTQVPADGEELAHFLNNYSSDPLNSLFVGSSLAELGGKEDETGFGSLLGSSAAGLGVEGETTDEALVKDDTGQGDLGEEIR